MSIPGPGIIGIVTGLRSEADLVRQAAARHAPEDAVSVECAGPGPDNADKAATRLLDSGATALASVGLAGGLKMSLWPGMVIVARAVIGADGTRHQAEAGWHREILGALLGDDEVIDGELVEARAPVADAAGKSRLFDDTGASAVDMESGAVAASAESAGVPFIAVRAIADPAELAIPPSALAALRPDGSISPGAAVAQLITRPLDIPTLIRLGLCSRRAHASLRRVLAATAALTCMGGVEKR